MPARTSDAKKSVFSLAIEEVAYCDLAEFVASKMKRARQVYKKEPTLNLKLVERLK